jgi:hypothetical protein
MVKGLGFVALNSEYFEEAAEDYVATFVKFGVTTAERLFSAPTSKQAEWLKQEVAQRGAVGDTKSPEEQALLYFAYHPNCVTLKALD